MSADPIWPAGPGLLLFFAMLWLLAALTLSASPDPVHRIAIPGLNCANLDTKLANALVMHFAQQLTIHGGFGVSQAALGLAPFSTGLGALSVRDELEVRFRIVAVAVH